MLSIRLNTPGDGRPPKEANFGSLGHPPPPYPSRLKATALLSSEPLNPNLLATRASVQ